jgi:hypothetical protein
MINVLVVARDGHPERGDFLVAALSDAPWGTGDLELGVLIEWDDPVLEAELLAAVADDNPYPRRSYPYATGEQGEEGWNQSGKTLDLDSIPTTDLAPPSGGLKGGGRELDVSQPVDKPVSAPVLPYDSVLPYVTDK